MRQRHQWRQQTCYTHRTAYAEVLWACRLLPPLLLAPLVSWRTRTPTLSAAIVSWFRHGPSAATSVLRAFLTFGSFATARCANP